MNLCTLRWRFEIWLISRTPLMGDLDKYDIYRNEIILNPRKSEPQNLYFYLIKKNQRKRGQRKVLTS